MELKWYSSVYLSMFGVSIILFLIYFFTSSTVSANTLIAGFSSFSFALSMVIVLIMQNQAQMANKPSMLSLMITTGSLVGMLGIIGFLFYLVVMFKNEISAGHVSAGYGTFMNIALLLLFVQIYLLKQNNFTHITSITGGVISIINLLLFICGWIIYTILKYYTTDG